jgi:hypothetical protein
MRRPEKRPSAPLEMICDLFSDACIGPILTRETAIVALSEKKSALNEQPESCFIDIQRGNTGTQKKGAKVSKGVRIIGEPQNGERAFHKKNLTIIFMAKIALIDI